MPAIGTKTGKTRQVEKILKKKRNAPPKKPVKFAPKKTRPAPKKQPGPVSDSERAAGDKHKQSGSYIRDLQKARGKGIVNNTHRATSVLLNHKRTEDSEKARKYEDTQHSKLYERAGYEEDPKTETERNGYGGNKGKGVKHELARKLEAQRDTLRQVNNSSEASDAIRRKIREGVTNLEAGKEPKAKKQPPLHRDEPRTDTELRKYLKDGKRPVDRLHIKSTHTSGGAASSGLEVLKTSAKGLHANAEVLTGGNWWEGFKHGHKTGSDVLKKLGVKNKTVAAGGGFLLDIPLSGAGLKMTVRSPAKKLEQEANRAERFGKTEKAAKKRDQAKTADTNRGAGIGVSARVPFSHRGVDKTVGEKTTAKVSKALGVPKRASTLHDSRAGQAVGKAAVPHYRNPDTPQDVHAKDVKNQRAKHAKDREAERHAERRGRAFEDAVPPSEEEAFLRGLERQPHEPVKSVKETKRRSPLHRAVKKVERKVVSNQRKLDRQRGYVSKEHPIEDKATLREVRKTVDDAIAKQHEKAQKGADDAEAQLKTLDEKARKKGIEPGPTSHEEARGVLEAELAKGNAEKASISGGEFRMPHGADETPRATQLRTLAAHESRLESMRHRLAEAEKNGVKGNGKVNKAGPETVNGLRGEIKRVEAAAEDIRTSLRSTATAGTHAAERNAEKVTREYHSSIVAKRFAGGELRKARIAYRNHFGEDPVTGAKVKGDASALYDDAAREKTLDRLGKAEEKMAAANARYKLAEQRLRQVAERHTAQQARRVPTSGLPGLGRKRPKSLDRLQRLEANDVAHRAELRAARAAANGKPKIVKTLIDKETGRPVQDVLKERTRHEIADITNPRTRAAAEQARRELDALHAEQAAAGRDLSKTPDYFRHVAAPQEGIRFKFSRSGRAARSGQTRLRKDPRDILSQHIEEPGKFDTNVHRVMARSIVEGKKTAHDVEYLTNLRDDVGRKYTSEANVRKDESVFHIDPAKGVFKALEDRKGDLEIAEINRLKESGNLVVLPKSIGARELKARTPVDPNALNTLGAGWDRVTSWWKTGVTTLNVPFYQERNLYDDTLRFWMGDGDPKSLLDAARLVKGLHGVEKDVRKSIVPGLELKGTVNIGATKMTRAAFAKQAIEDGAIRAGHYGGDLHEAIHAGQAIPKRTSTSALRDFGSNLEDIPRAGTYLAALRRGMSREDAASWTRLHHFDYTELTDAERAVRRFIPFYTFTSRNLQLQFRKALTRPGKYAIIEAFREEAAKLAGLPPNWEDDLSEPQRRALPIPFRTGPNSVRMVYTGFSITDLNRIPLPGQSVGDITRQQFDLFRQMLHPLPKAAWELLDNRSFFFRSPIYRSPDEPDAPRWVPAPSLVGALPEVLRKHLNITKIRDAHTGKMVWGWPSQTDYFVRQLPQTGYVATLGTPTNNSRGQSGKDIILGQATGLRTVKMDSNRGDLDRLYNQINNLTAEINDLTDQAKDGDGEFFWSKRKQQLVDEKAQLQKRADELRTTIERPTRSRRPQSPQQQYQERLKKQRSSNPQQEYQRKIAKEREARRILNGG